MVVPKKTTNEPIVIQRIGRAMCEIRIEGTAPLIVNRFAAKARQMMLDKQMGKKTVREAKNPDELYEASLYPMSGERYGFPSTGFKASIVDAARYFKGTTTMTELQRIIFVPGEPPELLVEIDGVPKMREDPVRNATGVADIRFRGEFWPWAVTLTVVYVRQTLRVDSVVALVDAAGIGGIGEWRPSSKQSKSGMFGTFKVVDDQDIKEITL